MNCTRVFDSSGYHHLLSAAWECRRNKVTIDEIKFKHELTENNCDLIQKYVIDSELSHDEFVKRIKSVYIES